MERWQVSRADGGSLSVVVRLLDALGDAAAVLDVVGAGRLVWCSASFAELLPMAGGVVPEGLPLGILAARLEGLSAGVAAARAAQAVHVSHADGEPGWVGALGLRVLPGQEPRWLAARLCALQADAARVSDGRERGLSGLWVLRLGAEVELGSATRRHMEDRERLLFTSRSLAVGEMASTLAHELNQPLGAVGNVLRGLKARLAAVQAQPVPPTPQALQQLAQGVQLASDQVQYAARIIGRVRDYTQSHQPRRERVDVMALLHNSLTLLDWDLERHHVQFSVSADLPGGGALPPVAGDGVMLQQVLVNLLRNAIDAMVDTPVAQRRLDVVCRVDTVDDRVEIAIADSGCGVGQDAAAQLFTPFFSTKPTGTGVGLNICRSLIELHQGRLWFSSNAQQGCTFYVALPMAQAPKAMDGALDGPTIEPALEPALEPAMGRAPLPDFPNSKDFVV